MKTFLHPLTHDYWTLKPLGDFDNKSSANRESVAEDKANIKNLSKETETDDEKASGGNDGMEVEDGEDIGHIEAQMTPEVDNVVGSETKSDDIGGADGTDGKEEKAKEKNKENWSEEILNKVMGETISTSDKRQTSSLLNPVIAQKSSVEIEEAKDKKQLQGDIEKTTSAKERFTGDREVCSKERTYPMEENSKRS